MIGLTSATAQSDGPKFIRLALPLWYMFVALATIAIVVDRLPLPKNIAPIERMSFGQPLDGTAIAGGQIADQAGKRSTVSLPDNWRNFPNRSDRSGIYQATFDYAAGDDKKWSVFITRYSGIIHVAVNGVDLPTSDLISGRQIANQSAPFIALLPHQILKATGNTIEITLEPGGLLSGFLDTVYIGSDADLRSSFTWHYYRFLRGPTLVTFWQILLSGMLLMLWLSRREERAALFCSLYLLTGCIHALPMLMPHLKVFADQLTMFTYVATFWQASCAFMFIVSLLDRKLPFHWGYIFAAPLFATISYMVLPDAAFQYVSALVVIPFSLVLGLWIIAMVADGSIRQGRWDCHFLLASGLGGMAMGIHDTLIISNVIDTSNSLKNSIVLIIFLPSISLIFLRHLIDSLDNVDNLVESLEHRVQTKETQLRQAFDERQALERQKALSDERQRIMRDVHDGLGGQLMSIIALSRVGTADSRKIENSARSALEEMRMVIGSLGVDDDITGMLGTFRERAEQQLSLFGITLNWQMTHIPLIDGLTPSHALNVLRILQEATTNAAKHSGATTVAIRFSVLPEPETDRSNLKIEIEDDGCGYSAPETNGHGIKNMKKRAVALGGEVTVEAIEKGCRVTFVMPIVPAGEALPDRFTGLVKR